MIIFNEENTPELIDSIHVPLKSEYMWVLTTDTQLDFTLQPIKTIEESHQPCIGLEIQGFQFYVPTSWYILCTDPDTMQLDTIQVGNIAGTNFHAVICGPRTQKITFSSIKAIDYQVELEYISPTYNKRNMICHAINSNAWVSLSIMDLHKYIKNCYVGDLI